MTSFLRQQDLIDANRLAQTSITIIGVGAVGSFTALALAKMGAQDITVYDPDIIEDHNLPNQFYRELNLGMHKVEALAGIIEEHTGITINSKAVKYVDQELKGIVICCVDSMDARLAIWRQVKKAQVDLYLDARMGAEVARIYTINPIVDSALYQESLYPSREAIEEPCTRRSIIYTVLGISAFICGQVKKFIANEPTKKEIILDFKLGMIQ